MKWKRLIFSCFILGVLSTGFATFAEESQSYMQWLLQGLP